MSKIRVRLLGGFEVWSGDHQVGGFESQKVRALLSYLVCHRRRAFSRDHLAGLLWPERDPESARHALRQAVYNLRSKLAEGGSALVVSNHLEIGLDPEADLWLDVEEFETALSLGTERKAIDPHHLSTAVQLYRGELLAGFFVKDGPEFEEWMVGEQVRLREAAVEVLRKLIESYRRRGEYRFGVHYARRLVSIEPLSEEAHRELMRLCALAGQRSRALAQYEKLLNLLQDELGVEPLEETRALYESILAEGVEGEAASRDTGPIGPLIPLVGRRETWALLHEDWLRVTEGRVVFTLVSGENGIGKTRLIKSFLDATTSKRRTTVLKGRGYELSPLVPYQPFVEVLRSALVEETEAAEQALAAVPYEVLEDVVRLVPELRDLRPDLPSPRPLDGPEARQRLFGSVCRFLAGLCQDGDPLILFLDDLHLADRDTFSLLAFLETRLEGPIWLLATAGSGLDRDHPLNRLLRQVERDGRVTRVRIERLEAPALEEVAAVLVGEAQAAELAGFLADRSAGLPLAMAEAINLLWDEGALVLGDTGSWGLRHRLDALGLPNEDLEDLIRLRIRRLPTSTRRLASLAAIMGHSFEVHLLQEAADEHGVVVEVGLELLLERWLVRQFAHSWTGSRRERDIVLWARGARRGNFEFAHKRIRGALRGELNPLRRQAMHAQVADVLARLQRAGDGEALAYHYVAAGEWEKAIVHLEGAMERALSVMAEETARHYCDQLIEVLDRLTAAARNDAQAQRWRGERERMQDVRERMAGTRGGG